jgi:hypothetical protein
MLTISSSKWWLGTGLAVVLAGCGPTTVALDPVSASGAAQGPKFTGPNTDAGVAVTQSSDATQFPKLVATNARRFHTRPDPFALTSAERSFDFSQEAEKVFGEIGGFPTYVQPEESVAPTLQLEPQPYRRLSGVVVGDSVLAIIEMGPGEGTQLIRPGQRIPNSPWTVVSIDQDRAVLRRDGDVLPKEIEVRLETPPPGYGPAATPEAPTGGPPGFGGGPRGPGGPGGRGQGGGGGGRGGGSGE